jgi:hypothetical protein
MGYVYLSHRGADNTVEVLAKPTTSLKDMDMLMVARFLDSMDRFLRPADQSLPCLKNSLP